MSLTNTVQTYAEQSGKASEEQACREMSLEEMVETLPPAHRANGEYRNLLAGAEKRWKELFDKQKKYWKYGWIVVSCFILLNLVVIAACLWIQLARLEYS